MKTLAYQVSGEDHLPGSPDKHFIFTWQREREKVGERETGRREKEEEKEGRKKGKREGGKEGDREGRKGEGRRGEGRALALWYLFL